jgi:hypothetical protein
MDMSQARVKRAALVAGSGALLALTAATGCQDAEESDLAVAEQDQGLLFASDDVVVDWNEHTIAAITTANGYQDPMDATRVLSMVHVAMHDAVNATAYRFYQSYAFTKRDRVAHPVAAAAAAAQQVLVRLFPSQEVDLAEKLERSLADVRDGVFENRGVALGREVGDFIFALRQNDGSNEPLAYTPGDEPGDYQFTSPGFIARPEWQNVTPWALESAAQFRPEPPPALTSQEYALAYEEVRTKGDADQSTRTPDETAYAQFWYEFSDLGWNRVTRGVVEQERLGLAQSARLFALVNMAMADGYIAGWDGKFFYDFWRPVTAIHRGETDGNPNTTADLDFEPFLFTPPVQDYPSTHSVLGSAAAEVLTRFFGKRGEHIGFSMTSSSASQPNLEVRSFESFRKAARENADSRVMAGIHFRFAAEAGMELGTQIGEYAFENYLRSLY